MRTLCYYAILFLACAACVRQPSLPANSKYNVIATLNDTAWYGTGKVLRIKEPNQQKLEDVRQFNLIIFTDIDYAGMSEGLNPNTNNGCLDPECTRTQSLVIYNIPLKKGRTTIAKLNKRRKLKHEYPALSYIGNAGGLNKRYIYKGLKPGWIRVTKYDRVLGTIEGRFSITFNEDMGVYARIQNGMPETARFADGLFRIKIKDVLLR